MAAVALRSRVSPGERPGAVVNLRHMPPRRLVTMRTPSVVHLFGELVSVRILMTVGARLVRQMKVQQRRLRLVTRRAGSGRVRPFSGNASKCAPRPRTAWAGIRWWCGMRRIRPGSSLRTHPGACLGGNRRSARTRACGTARRGACELVTIGTCHGVVFAGQWI